MSDALAPKHAADSVTDMVQIVRPPDANALETAFGGTVMGWIDICAAVAAQRHSRQSAVTASMDALHFHAPIRIGWVVNVRARVIAAFHSSMEIGVTVHAENPRTGERRLATSALLTFVALDSEGRKLPVPPLVLETETEKQAAAEATQRRAERLARKDQGKSWLAVVGG